MSTTVEKKFYRIFWRNSACQSIFLRHKELILEKQVIDIGSTKKSFYLQRIVLSNDKKRKEHFKRIEDRIENRSIDIAHSLESTMARSVDEQWIEEYFMSKFGRPIELITKKLDGGNVGQIRFLTELSTAFITEKRFLKFLKKYHFISEDVGSLNQLATTVQSLFEKELSALINNQHIEDILKSLGDMANAYDNQIFESLVDANQFYTDVLYDDENYQDRMELFDSLYEAEVIRGGEYKTYYECTNCREGVFSGSVMANVTPSKVKLRCPNCSKSVFFLAPYKINDDIFSHIKHKDGLLFFALQHLLADHNLRFYTNVVVEPDIEQDIQVVNNQNHVTDILEVKMYKNDTSYKAQLGNLRTAAQKVLTMREKLIEINDGYANITFHLISNLTEQELYDEVRGELIDMPIVIHSPSEFFDVMRKRKP